MSFLENIPTKRSEEIRTAFQSLNHDILRQQGFNPPTPPLTPETIVPPLQPTCDTMFPTRSNINPMFSTYENRSEHASLVPPRNVYSHIRGYNTSPVTENRLGYPSQWSHKNEQCSCCTDRSVLPSRDIYHTHSHDYPKFSGSNIEESSSYPMQPKDNMTPTLIQVPAKRRFDYGSTDTSPKRMRLTESVSEPSVMRNGPITENENQSEKIACQVHGILSLPGSREPRYEISKSELERRVNEPECLTKVDMISYVRLAKNSARTLLEKNDIRTNQHNKRSEHTVLSKICEAECQVLAKGLREINFRYFPGTWFAKKSVQEISRTIPSPRQQRETLRDRIRKDEITKCVLLDIYFGLEERANDEEMSNFNRMSHTFGVANLRNHIEFLYRYLKEEMRMLETMYADHS